MKHRTLACTHAWVTLPLLVAGLLVTGCPQIRPPGVESGDDAGPSSASGGSSGTASGGPASLSPPVGITRMEPSRGPSTGGTVLVLHGYNFTPTVHVTVGGAPAQDVTVTDGQTLSLATPAGQEGGADVVVENSDGARATFAAGFTYYVLAADAPAAPVLTAVLPNTGPTPGGTVAALPGAGFQQGALVIVGGRASRQVKVVGDALITATLPGGPAGTTKVAVTNPDGRSGLLLGAFAFYDPSTAGPAPQVLSITPSDGPVAGGAATTLQGVNLDAAVRAYLGGIPLQLSQVTPGRLSFLTPPGTRGLAAVAVTNPDGQSAVLSDGYNYFWPPPVLHAVEPMFVPAATGGPVTVRGRWFMEGAAVSVGGELLMNVAVVGADTITGVVPPAVAGGPVDVTVHNPDGLSATLPAGLLYTDEGHPPPHQGSVAVWRLVPSAGPTTGGAPVTLFGAGFLDGATVTVGSAAATGVRVLSSTALSFTSPPGALGPAHVTVTVPGLSPATLSNGFTFFDPSSAAADPSVTGVSPRVSRLAGGGTAVVMGAGFAADARVYFGAAQSSRVRVVPPSTLSALVPPGQPGTVDVLVVNPDGRSGRLANGFAYLGGAAEGPAPGISYVSPATGLTVEETPVDVVGSGLHVESQVFVDGVPAPTLYVSDTRVTAVFPPHAEGTYDVTLTNPDGQSATAADAFTYQAPPAPVVSRVDPAQGVVDQVTPVTIHGQSFRPGAQAWAGEVLLSTTDVDASTLTAVMPARGAGAIDVKVVNPDGQWGVLPGGFTYVRLPAPVLTRLEPAEGPAGMTTVVRLVGSHFQEGVTARVGDDTVAATFLDSATLTVLMPAKEAGVVAVTVRNPDGQEVTLAAAFTYARLPAPTITSLTPATGSTRSATVVTVTGTGFMDGSQVLVAGEAVVTTPGGATTLTAEFPPRAAGAVDVRVRNPDGQSVTLRDGFTYATPPPGSEIAMVVTRAEPPTGPSTGGTTINLVGQSFHDGVTVTVGGGQATEVVVLGPTLLSFRLPAGMVGPAAVQVHSTARGVATLTGGFSYHDPDSVLASPSLLYLGPTMGPVEGGTRVLLRGAGFVNGCRVFVGAREATPATWVSPEVVVVDTPAVAEPGTASVLLVNPDGRAGVLVPGFTYYRLPVGHVAPRVTAVTPAQGSTRLPTLATVSGTGFHVGALLYAGRVPAAVTVVSPEAMEATMPAQPTGTVDVVVVNPDGSFGVLAAGFTYPAVRPVVSSVQPGRGPLAGGLSVAVLGEGFEPGARVLFGRAEVAGVAGTDGMVLRATVPAGPAGLVDVTVVNPDGRSGSLVDAFAYDPTWAPGPRPEVTVVQPGRGPSTGGSAVLVKGAGLVPGCAVLFADRPATGVVVLDQATVFAVTPAVAPGPAHVSVVNPDGQVGVLAGGFTYVAPETLGTPPTLTGVSPATGKESMPTTALLTGRGLRSGAFVFFGGFPAGNPLLLSSTIMQAEARPHVPGTVDVALTNPDGQSAFLRGAFTYVPLPSLASLTPHRGPTAGGTEVLVAGDGFQPGLKLLVGGLEATGVVVQGPTLLSCVTPPGHPGLADAEVRNPDGQNSVMAGAFTYDPPPSITRITPSSGPATGGTVAVLAGGSFMEGVTVKVGSVTASSRLVATDQVVVRLPPGVVGFADVTVENPDGQRATAQRLFQYRDPATMGPAPTLTELVPARGPLSGGTLALMAGAGFGEGMVAFLDMAPVSALFVAAADVATAVTPLGRVPGAVDLAVTNPDGQSAHLAGAFTYVAPASLGPAPALATVTPQEASIFGGSLVAAGGANFAAGALFFFGGRPSVSVTVEGGSAATVVAPAGLPGPAAVAMTNPDGQTATYLGAFSYVVPAPQILVVNPNTGTGRGGTAITISGRNFQEGAVVRLGAAFCQSTVVVDPTRLACVTPPGVDGPAVVSVTNQDGQSAELAAGYTYVAPPDPQRVSPTSGPQAGGTAISITGAFFRPGVSVHVGGVACLNVARVSAALLNCDTPPGAVPGPAAVVVTNTDGQDGTVAAGFTYLPPIPPPSVTKVTPNHGSRRGGDGVTVVGESFQVGAVVSFGGTAAPVANVMSSTAISVITPAHAEGTVEVVVVNPDGQSARKEAAFQYLADGTLPPLVVTAITPNTGSVTGNTQITLTGNGFQAGLAVTVGAALCGSVTRLGPTAVTCKTPPVGAPGTVNVTVTNPDGQQVVVVGGYTYDTKRRFVLEGHNLPAEASRFKVAAGLADLDGDGDLDVFEVMANISGSNPSGTALPRLRINDGLGRFVERTAGLPAEPSGNTSRSWVSMVDVDGDGDIDPVFFKEGEMVIYVNDGTATFTRRSAPVCRDSGNNIRNMSITSFAPLDLEGDGDVDFVVGRWSDRTDCWVSGAWVAVTGEVVMVNDGVGNFAFSYTRIPPVQDATTSVKAADLDRDGDMDILVTNENNHQNRLYYNDGAGYFTDVSLSLLGVSAGNARDAVIGDIEGDGDLDIFIAFNGQRNRLYVNLGTGAFTDVTLTGRMPEVTENSYRMWLLDHDGDGDLDLWVRRVPTTGFLQPFRVHQNDGTGWFLADSANALLPASLREEVASAGPGDMAAYAFGDLDRDGYVDMFWGQSGWQDRILLNDTQGGFDFRTISSVTEMRANAEDAASGDLDGDGDVDVVMCQSSEMGVRVFLNDAAGNLVDVTEARFPAVRFSCSDIDLADVDRDGDLDILVAATTTPIPSPSPSGATGASVYLFINNGLGVFRDETNPRLPTDSLNRGLAPLAMEPLDYDNDGDMDLMVGRNGCASSGNGLRLWENAALGSGHYVDVTDTALARVSVQLGCYYGTSCGNVVDIQVGDVDNNGTVDVFAARLGRGCYMADSLFNNVILFNTGDRKFEDVTTSKMASPVQGRKARLFHANGDGTLDLYLVYDTDDRLYLNTGGGIFSDVTPSNLPRVDNSRGAVDVDVDGDGDMDLVVVKTGAARPRLLLNTGLGIFGDYSDGKIPVLEDVSVNVLSADFTGDGMGDLFVVNQGQCRVLVNKP